jgi:transcriptional regulator with XRE-family HTH domain
MTTCNASTVSLSLAQRLKAARRALPAKQDEIATLWQLANRQVVSDWERGRYEIPAEMIPKIEQLERWAAAGGGLDAARAELARLKDAELAAQLERVQHKATTWQALGSRPVPLIESAQLELSAAQPIPPAPRVEPASQPPADPYKVTIDWEAFVVEVDGQRGVSLRELVKAGLYARYEDAAAAARAMDLEGFTAHPKNPNGGRPGQDFLISDWRAAQKFCVRARTPMGERIADLILDHHEEFQRLLSGDAGAQARLDEAQATHERIEAAAPVPTGDPLLDLIGVTGSMRRVQLDQQARIEALEARERIRQEESEQALARIKAVGLPAPSVAAPQHTPRTALGAHMARLGVESGGTEEAHHAIWLKLYSEYERRAHIDLRARAKNAKSRSIAAYAEAHGHVDALYALACELWPGGAGDARA